MAQSFDRLQSEIEARKAPRTEPLVRVGPVVTAGVTACSLIIGGTLFGLHMASGELDSATAEIHRAEIRWLAAASEKEQVQRELAATSESLEEVKRVSDYAAAFQIDFELADAIYRHANRAGVYPRLAFELIRVESRFHKRAVSPVGALGYTQLMPATARMLSPGITREEIFERENNLRLGMTFLSYLLDRYDSDVRLALLAYNRGPTTVDSLLAIGEDPENGYSRMVLDGYPYWPFSVAQSTAR